MDANDDITAAAGPPPASTIARSAGAPLAAQRPQPYIPQVQAALVNLDTALDPDEFATVLLATGPRRWCLSVASRHTQTGDDIWADNRAYYFSWVLHASSACRATLHRTAQQAAFATHLPGCRARHCCCSEAR